MNGKNIPDKVIMKSHCDQVISLMNEIKAYLERKRQILRLPLNLTPLL